MNALQHAACPACGAVNRVDPTRAEAAACGRCRAALFPGAPLDVTAATFARQVETGDLPVVVDFWAPWGGPCRAMAPAYAQAAATLAGKVRLAKVDTEAEPALAQRFCIRSIPKRVAFPGGREVARVSGALPAAQLLAWIAQHAA